MTLRSTQAFVILLVPLCLSPHSSFLCPFHPSQTSLHYDTHLSLASPFELSSRNTSEYPKLIQVFTWRGSINSPVSYYPWKWKWRRSVVSDSLRPHGLSATRLLRRQSMEFFRQEYWSGLPFLSPGDLPDPGIEPRSPALQEDALPSEPQGSP